MSAQLNLNTHQAYGFAYDQTAVGWLVPQNSFADCAKGLKDTAFTEEAANLIQRIHDYEGTSLELLAVTFLNEGDKFNLRTGPNTNGVPEDVTRWDVGPFQINIYWTLKAIEKKEVSWNGLIPQNVWGYAFYHSDGKTPLNEFTGEPLSNGRMAARRLNTTQGKTAEDKAANYTKPSSRAHRRQSYQTYAPKFKAFFDCFRR